MDQATECVETAEVISPWTDFTKLTGLICKVYYKLTVHFPRPLPRNEKELVALKKVMVEYFGIEDSPTAWYVIAGQISATPATKMHKSYAHYVNAARRLNVNTLAHRLKEFIIKEHEEKLKSLTEKVVASPSPEPTPSE